jgi:diphthamide synthase (EF-2-diphthine--ammonia ligase)
VPPPRRPRPAPAPRPRVILTWSGGKDSALSLRALREQGVEVGALLTTMTEETGRVSMHGVRRELVVGQAGFVFCDLLAD